VPGFEPVHIALGGLHAGGDAEDPPLGPFQVVFELPEFLPDLIFRGEGRADAGDFLIQGFEKDL